MIETFLGDDQPAETLESPNQELAEPGMVGVPQSRELLRAKSHVPAQADVEGGGDPAHGRQRQPFSGAGFQ